MGENKVIPAMVYEHTFYPSGKYRHYLSVAELQYLLQSMIAVNETADYVKATPFYRAEGVQYEFDDHMLFVKRLMSHESENEFLQACSLDEYGNTCAGCSRCYKGNDLQAFQGSLRDCIAYIPALVNDIYEALISECNICHADLLMGSICFEVHAG